MEMYSYRYPRPMLTADCVVFGERKDGTHSLLLVRRGGDPYKGMWALPGGFMEMDETLEACARRELQEETGCAITAPLVELGSFSRVDRDPRGRTVTVAFMAEVEECPVRGGDDAREEAFGHVVDMLLEQRAIAKANKDWATSDRIRNELNALGFEIKDGKDGSTWTLNK
jgi:8-oxo-dGTP diphosphatase